ncbi:MAG: hypothetical protein RL637_1015 [Pseudomonadota bacterium]|jgi:hypothetical protein
MKFSVLIKKLKNPRVRKRLKIALSVYGIAILLGIAFKMVYDIGHFNALAVENEKNKQLPSMIPQEVLTAEIAQKVITGALKENPQHPNTILVQIVNNERNFASIIIEKDNIRKVAWILDRRLFFSGDLLNESGYNITKAIERQHNINNADY